MIVNIFIRVKIFNICNDYITLQNKGPKWTVPIYIRDKEVILYINLDFLLKIMNHRKKIMKLKLIMI